MERIKVVLLTIYRKFMLILLGVVIGSVLGFLTSSIIAGFSISIIIIFGLYWRIFGPMHYVTKKKIQDLVDEGVIIDTDINPNSNELKDYNFDGDWFVGWGVFVRFTDFYYTKAIAKGIAFYNSDMPYLPIYIIPYSSIATAIENTDFLKELNENCLSTFELKLTNGYQIALPLDEKVFSVVNGREVADNLV
ncbi:MAG: hypothetical protein ACJAUY_002102 [Cognaticolwellia sp.]|jgi:hypothetical protein